jgi:hypothetical protein
MAREQVGGCKQVGLSKREQGDNGESKQARTSRWEQASRRKQASENKMMVEVAMASK